METDRTRYLIPLSLLLAVLVVGIGWIYREGRQTLPPQEVAADISRVLLPAEGITLPVRWGNLGAQLVTAGVIDADKFESLYRTRGGLTKEEKTLLTGEQNVPLKIDAENAPVILNLLWAFGLANKNSILTDGPMADPRYGGAQNFASTGGWTLSKGDTMTHYSAHPFITLTKEQQELVERVSKNIYRPCCGNATYFPDCNHGMAMLGLLELMAAQGADEAAMYRAALAVNSYWFPDQYRTIAAYLKERGTAWEEADQQALLGYDFSSGEGFQRVLAETKPVEKQGGGSCGV
ncbi:hypothetical protein COU12_01325 [Candidatus Jorgensenbacteria bacterium CG10_big_fil_rev_8_21_14_0_10_54_38]|uniref:Uncharacterized protein n=2 Tax=Candidatus Joergenseniibacteriota TaxID=1752739 RepID=A0A2M6WG54_9BACT|nr:MAG: hypothetical protein COX26_02680 [Candidatus Jorgensenbacteria bacterium CG23_combo_of_CG06-09_8_20_14_all_54_14]PIT91762.1 MAG: hypothetical protein COU12_01325 [Candidatus Jorgensenbacteria bacterium CG10_big_fil_rev_8_21_14_0_10_54_38]